MKFYRDVPAAVLLLALATSARATFHEWLPEEIFSNASGTVQFIEFTDANNGEEFLTNTTLESNAHTYHFTTDLPTSSTAGHHLLIGTPGYAALPGVPAPDYTLPINNFFSTSGDSVFFLGTVQPHLTFTNQLPTDGIHSLLFNGTTLSTGLNSPTNFAGAAGSVPEPGTLAVMGLGAAMMLRRRRRAPHSA